MDYEIVEFRSLGRGERFRLPAPDNPPRYDVLPSPEYQKFFINTYQPLDADGRPAGPPENRLASTSKVARRLQRRPETAS